MSNMVSKIKHLFNHEERTKRNDTMERLVQRRKQAHRELDEAITDLSLARRQKRAHGAR